MVQVRRLIPFLAALLLSTPVLAAGTGYADVPEDAWYAPAVVWCRERGIADPGETFSPQSPATRGMVVLALWRLDGSPSPDGAASFPDVPERYAEAVSWAVETGVANGYDAGRFGPDDPVTRQQLAAFLWRRAGRPVPTDSDPFTDSGAVSAYATDAVRWARSAGAVEGYADGSFRPWDGATRAHLAQIIKNLASGTVLEALDGVDAACAPYGLALLPDGSLLVTDGWSKVVRRIADGIGTVYAGAAGAPDASGEPAGGSADGPAASARFGLPWAIAPYGDGWAVTDADGGTVRLIAADESVTTYLPRTGGAFQRPTGTASADDGSVYVADALAGTVRRIAADGSVSTAASGLDAPTGLCWKDGVLYIAETGACRVLRLVDGRVETLAGSGEEGSEDGPAASATFTSPQGVAVGDDGTVYVADTVASAVRRIRDGVVDTIASRDPAELGEGLVSPAGMLIRDGRLLVCDRFSRAVWSLPIG